MSVELTDHTGYKIKKDLVDLCILTLAAREEGVTTYEAQSNLFELEVGNARSADRYELSWSSTGAIFRAATNTLRDKKLIVDTFFRPEVSPFRYYITNAGAEYLATINPPLTESRKVNHAIQDMRIPV